MGKSQTRCFGLANQNARLGIFSQELEPEQYSYND